MKLLVVTNLYPPQELGGYGRCISDFVWGLMQLDHHIHVACSDAPYLSPASSVGPSGESVSRTLSLKGSFDNGISEYLDQKVCSSIDRQNFNRLNTIVDNGWDGFIVGNLDLLGVELLRCLFSAGRPVLHHIGFVNSPYPLRSFPRESNYHLIPASNAVKDFLCHSNFPVTDSPVIFPGVRLEYFPLAKNSLSPALDFASAACNAGVSLGSPSNPLKIGFAGLLMASKGAHTLVQSLIELYHRGYSFQANFAGASFQPGYREKLELMLANENILDMVSFVGNLEREQLARFWSLHHIGVFPSIHPEAFGISAAEVMASGLLLLSTGVGGASEVFEDQVSGIRFSVNDHQSLTESIISLIHDPERLLSIAMRGRYRAIHELSVNNSAFHLEKLLLQSS